MQMVARKWHGYEVLTSAESSIDVPQFGRVGLEQHSQRYRHHLQV